MIIGIAGPYSADTAEGKLRNLERLNETAAKLLQLGHIPLVGINAALPVLEKCENKEDYKAMMKISLAVISACDALFMIGESPGAVKERELIVAAGKPVYYSLEEIPSPQS